MFSKTIKVVLFSCINFNNVFAMDSDQAIMKKLSDAAQQSAIVFSSKVEKSLISKSPMASIAIDMQQIVDHDYLSSVQFHEFFNPKDISKEAVCRALQKGDGHKKSLSNNPDIWEFTHGNLHVLINAPALYVFSVKRDLDKQEQIESSHNKENLRLILRESLKQKASNLPQMKKVAKKCTKTVQKKRTIQRRKARDGKKKRLVF